MSDRLRQEIEWHRDEILRMKETMAKIESGSFYGESRAEVLSSMNTTLRHFTPTLAHLESRLAEGRERAD